MRLTSLFAVLGGILASAQSYPAEFGVDLVFPRPKDVYKRVFPFPVVLAVHGAPDIWPAGVSIKLELMRALEEAKPAIAFETRYINASSVVGTLPATRNDTYFAVVGMMEAAGSPTTDTFLRYEISIPMDCPAGEAAGRVAADSDIAGANRMIGSLQFKLDNEEGEDPEMIVACPMHLHTIRIDGRESEDCLLLGTPDYARIDRECRTSLPVTLDEVVRVKLDKIRLCANETEPTTEHDAFCNRRPFLLDEKEDFEDTGSGDWEGIEEADNGSDDVAEADEGNDNQDSTAPYLSVLGTVALLPLLATLL